VLRHSVYQAERLRNHPNSLASTHTPIDQLTTVNLTRYPRRLRRRMQIKHRQQRVSPLVTLPAPAVNLAALLLQPSANSSNQIIHAEGEGFEPPTVLPATLFGSA
jgi:hypothetical protein